MFSNLLSYSVQNWQVKLCCWISLPWISSLASKPESWGTPICIPHVYAEMWPWRLGCPVPNTVAGHVHQTATLLCWKFRENVCSIAQEEEPERAAPFSIELFQFPFKWWESFPPKWAVPAPSTSGKTNLPGLLALLGTLNWQQTFCHSVL